MPPADKAAGPGGRLRAEAGGLIDALAERAVTSVRDKVQDTTGRLTDYVEGEGGPGLLAAVTGAKGMAEGKGPVRSMLGAGFAGVKEKVSGMFGGGKKKGKGPQKLKVTNIVESIDVGVPVRLAYDQWTQFGDFPTFMKKVENIDQAEDHKLNWKAQVFWSHRTWESTIVDQQPDERIIWRSKGEKGHVDGAVTFHEITPTLTRIVVVLEYHPQGLFEKTGNIWRAQGRRVRLELKHFQRHVMSQLLLNAEAVEGWRGVIEDGEVVKDHETAMAEEEEASGQPGDEEEPEPEADDYAGDEYPEDEFADEEADEVPDEEGEEGEEAPADETESERPAARRRAGAGAASSGARRRPSGTRGGASRSTSRGAARR